MVAGVAGFVLLVACGDGDGDGDGDDTAVSTTVIAATTQPNTSAGPSTTAGSEWATLRVPDDHPTIQAAVDAARPGDLVLIAPGTYREAVQVTTDRLTIRGLDRNEVILDGDFELDNGIRVLGAKGVAIENMTAVNYVGNGFLTGVDGYRGSYLTTYRIGDYGVYAFDSINGHFDHLYLAGSPESGLYIGECYPCNAVVTDVVSEYNGLGFSGTNAGGELYLVNSVWRHNRAGIMPNSGTYELCYPQREVTIVGNLVYDNNATESPSVRMAIRRQGTGIVIAGGTGDVVERNLVYGNDRYGIFLTPFLELSPNDEEPTRQEWGTICADAKLETPAERDDPIVWDVYDTRVVGNELADNGVDLVLATVDEDPATLGNCFADNIFTTSAPRRIETLAPCTGEGSGDWAAGAIDDMLDQLYTQIKPGPEWQTATLPPLQPQENMPDAATAPPRPATDLPVALDLAAIKVPARP
jgi:hypothetical protein